MQVESNVSELAKTVKMCHYIPIVNKSHIMRISKQKKIEKQPEKDIKQLGEVFFENLILIHKVLGSLNVPIITEHLESVMGLFSDVLFLEQQLIYTDDRELNRLYEEVLRESIRLVESLYISDERGSLSLVDKKFGEYITFRSQDTLRDALDAFWMHIEKHHTDMYDQESIRRSTLDTFFPLAVVYIHIFGHQKIIIKKLLKLYNSLSYEIMTQQGFSNRSEIMSAINFSKKYTKKMMRKV